MSDSFIYNKSFNDLQSSFYKSPLFQSMVCIKLFITIKWLIYNYCVYGVVILLKLCFMTR